MPIRFKHNMSKNRTVNREKSISQTGKTVNVARILEEEIRNLLERMTLEEKVSLSSGADRWHTVSVERLGVPAITMMDGPNGVRVAIDVEDKTSACFPVGICMGATWNPELIHRVGEALAEEAKHRGCDILLGPNVNIVRSPLNGRNFETYSEDPYLTSRIAVAFINGIQSQNVGASIKHYVCNNSEFERFTISSEVRERALREIYLPAFKAAVEEADPWTVMAAYNKINGTYATEQRYLLSDILKGEWGYKGFVVSDWGAVHSTIPAAKAGTDLEMPGPAKFFGKQLMKAVKEGKVSESVIDDKVRRILRIVFKSGAFEERKAASDKPLNKPEHQRLAREVASEGIVLLKNDRGILPIQEKNVRSIAVIGPNADEARIQGGGSANVNPYYAVSPLEGIRSLTRENELSIEIFYEQGCRLSDLLDVIDSRNLIPSEDEDQHGLTAEYFNNLDLSGEPFEKKHIDTLRLTSPYLDPKENKEAYSCRLMGRFAPPKTGTYRFSLVSLGLSRILCNNELIVDNWTKQIPSNRFGGLLSGERVGEIDMVAGETYDIEIDFCKTFRYAVLRVGCEIPIDGDPIDAAVRAATEADVAVVFVGLSADFESEGFDRPDMNLPNAQIELIGKVSSANKNTVVVLNTGAPVMMEGWIDKVSAVVQAWYPGQECGNAIADILFGNVNPSGKLPETFPRRLEDNPAYINYPGENGKVYYGEGIFVGYRYYDKKKIEPLFPFGHGLSYTTFDYSNLKLSSTEIRKDEKLHLTVDVNNTGAEEGKEVVQLYVQDIESSLARPEKELKGFKKIKLKPGEAKTVNFTLDRKHLSFYDPSKRQWNTEPGEFKVLIGSSSHEIRLEGSFSLITD